MIAAQLRTNELLAQLVQNGAVNKTVNVCKPTLQPEKTLIATPSKEELARQYLSEREAERKQSSRWLSENVKPSGVTISHVTWNKIKKEFT